MDMHVHLDGQQSADSYTEGFYLNPGDYALRASFYAKKTLLAGFTTVRNLGDTDYSTVALRKAIAAGWVEGPRVYTAGPAIGTTGSHADATNGYSDQVIKLLPSDAFDGADAGRALVREHVKHGVNVIKIMTTGGVLSLGDSAQGAQMTQEEAKAVVEAAHEYGLKVAVHAHGSEGMKGFRDKVLMRDGEGQHWLVTPECRQSIEVEDAAFIAVDVQAREDAVAFRLNTDELVLAGPGNPLRARGNIDAPAVYLTVRHGCEARLDRSTWLQLAEFALQTGDGRSVKSQGATFALVPA